jgi:SHS2 domain-containing protein
MRNYETFSTTADTGIRFKGRDFGELYSNALRGLNLLLFGANLRSASGCEMVPFAFRGDGPENVLVNFLSEVLFQIYRENRRAVACELEHADRSSIAATLRLAPCRRAPQMEVKAVTYHNLRVEEKNGVLNAAIIFDI